jgi:hypothetical protein
MNPKHAGLAIAAMLVLAACGPKPGSTPQAPEPDATPPAEPAGVTSKDFGEYVVHFNAITTDQLTPQVAKTHDIVRSRNRAMLNVSIVRKSADSPGSSVPGSVSALIANDTGQLKNATVREIREGDAVYYIADFPVSNAETIVFTIDAQPADETRQFTVRFTRTFYGE